MPDSLGSNNAPRESAPLFVLVRPTRAGNLGGAARALGNMGLTRLALVAPEISPLDDEALSWACNGAEILRQALVYDTLEDALKSSKVALATTGRKRERGWVSFENAAQKSFDHYPPHDVALVFGTEKIGLTHDEVEQCQYLTTIPCHPDHRSMNLAGAVLLMAHEVRRTMGTATTESEMPSLNHDQRVQLGNRLLRLVKCVGYDELGRSFNAEEAIRRLTMRPERIDPGDAQFIHALARHIEWRLNSLTEK